MATFMESMSFRLESRDVARVESLAARLSLPAGSVVRLLVRAGLDAVTRDPGLILGGEPAAAAPVAGLPPGTRTRASA